MLKPIQEGGIIMSRTHFAEPKSFIGLFRRKPKRHPPENNLRNLETRVKAGKGDTYQLLKFKDNIKPMV